MVNQNNQPKGICFFGTPMICNTFLVDKVAASLVSNSQQKVQTEEELFLIRKSVFQKARLLNQPNCITAGGSSVCSAMSFSLVDKFIKENKNIYFFGSIGDDENSVIFRKILETYGVVDKIVSLPSRKTAICDIYVTPDNCRTMVTWLGTSDNFSLVVDNFINQVEEGALEDGLDFFFDGYLFFDTYQESLDILIDFIRKTFDTKANIFVSLSDIACAKYGHKNFLKNEKNIDFLFGSEEEFSIYATKRKEAFSYGFTSLKVPRVITCGSEGAKGIFRNGVSSSSNLLVDRRILYVKAFPINLRVAYLEKTGREWNTKVLDTSGAGDWFAGSFLSYMLSDGFKKERGEYSARIHDFLCLLYGLGVSCLKVTTIGVCVEIKDCFFILEALEKIKKDFSVFNDINNCTEENWRSLTKGVLNNNSGN